MNKAIQFINVLFLLFIFVVSVKSQTNELIKEEVQSTYEEAIMDNSYFLEESYNQEKRVVQHIFNCNYSTDGSNGLMFTFTQEWPAFGQAHQLSYTLPYNSYNSGNISGLGDIMLNYRYQAFMNDKYAFSPRLSLVLPTGKKLDGFGYGTFGAQINLPFSIRLNNSFATHINAGMTLLPGAKTIIDGKEYTENLESYFAGASLIWHASRRFNFMIEYLTNFNEIFSESGKNIKETEMIVCPGFRYSLPVESLKMEIVPGLAVPFYFNSGDVRTGVFFYISFEHDY